MRTIRIKVYTWQKILVTIMTETSKAITEKKETSDNDLDSGTINLNGKMKYVAITLFR